ncbi:MAG: hypothetical protein ABIG63_02845 [Chloroflexota bacterium]
MKLPNNVIEALMKGEKIEAITLLRKERKIGLKEAKEIVEAYQQHREINAPDPVTRAKSDNDTIQIGPHALPDEVVDALLNERKIEAINILRKVRNIGLAEAKAMVEAFPVDQQSPGASVHRRRYRVKGALITLTGCRCVSV